MIIITKYFFHHLLEHKCNNKTQTHTQGAGGDAMVFDTIVIRISKL